MPQHRPDGHLGPRVQRAKRRQRVGAELARGDRQRFRRVGAVAADVDGQAMEAGCVEEDRHRQKAVPGGFPAVDQGDARTGRAVTSGDEPAGKGQVARMDVDRLERQAHVGRAELRRAGDRKTRSDPVEQCEPVGEGEGDGDERGDEAGPSERGHGDMGRPSGGGCQAGPVRTTDMIRPW